MYNELKKKGSFTMEITFEVDVCYEYMKINGEITIETIYANLENYKKEIDIFPYVPSEVVRDITEVIMEDIEMRSKDEGN